MNTATRLVAYLAGLAVLVAGGIVVGGHTPLGAAAGRASDRTTSSSQMSEMSTSEDVSDVPGGLQVAESGYALHLAATGYTAGPQQLVKFQISGPDGQPVTAYDQTHERDLHLIAVRRDFAGFQHVHPTLDTETGTWSVKLDLQPGTWRIFTDFAAKGADQVTLGSDLLVPGDPGSQRLPEPSRSSSLDRYSVAARGDLRAGQHSMLDFTIKKDGKPVTDLQPYLGAYGHLVALREGDLAYLHVHPNEDAGPGPTIEFGAEVLSAGRYHLFLDFKHHGVVRSLPVTLDATGNLTAGRDGDHDGGHGH